MRYRRVQWNAVTEVIRRYAEDTAYVISHFCNMSADTCTNILAEKRTKRFRLENTTTYLAKSGSSYKRTALNADLERSKGRCNSD